MIPIGNSGLRVAGLSHVGNKRTHNEDSIAIDIELGLAVLADGMGGYQGGQLASALAVKIIIDEVRARHRGCPNRFDAPARHAWHQSLLAQAFAKANGVIYHLAQRKRHYQGMGTTLIATLFHDGQVTIAHVGDSRVYRLRQNTLQQVTADHSLLQELLDRGFYAPEDLRHSLNKSFITRAVGIGTSVQPDIKQDSVSPSDLYLLCSDGLTDLVEDQEIQRILTEYHSKLRRAAVGLIRLANRRGGRDNISVILARYPSALVASGCGAGGYAL